MRVVAISDTHSRVPSGGVPDGDVLVHAGDLTERGTLDEIAAAGDWLRSLPHARKVVIAGNHDFGFEQTPEAARAALGGGFDYLEDSGVVIDSVVFWGAPWQPWFFDWAFNLPRGAKLAEKWALIPDDTWVLVTHGPPYGILDRTAEGEFAGCRDLAERVRLVRPAVHVFGHIHEGAGTIRDGDTLFVNASICDLQYAPVNPARVIDVYPPTRPA
ncbi:MAG: metallophosphatase domain-containing protein [Candidatus Eremiobacteraeota bacterium]|nr:metallophosphatase domain-containing protein [Candidatus Eremiobacteraeota bacterium]